MSNIFMKSSNPRPVIEERPTYLNINTSKVNLITYNLRSKTNLSDLMNKYYVYVLVELVQNQTHGSSEI